MLKSYRSVLAATTSVAALTIAGSMPASAQDVQEVQSIMGLESITVTARRVEENIQRVPIAIQAFTPEVLANQDIKDI
jgi:iron complex outermembrane receptor protein